MLRNTISIKKEGKERNKKLWEKEMTVCVNVVGQGNILKVRPARGKGLK